MYCMYSLIYLYLPPSPHAVVLQLSPLFTELKRIFCWSVYTQPHLPCPQPLLTQLTSPFGLPQDATVKIITVSISKHTHTPQKCGVVNSASIAEITEQQTKLLKFECLKLHIQILICTYQEACFSPDMLRPPSYQDLLHHSKKGFLFRYLSIHFLPNFRQQSPTIFTYKFRHFSCHINKNECVNLLEPE